MLLVSVVLRLGMGMILCAGIAGVVFRSKKDSNVAGLATYILCALGSLLLLVSALYVLLTDASTVMLEIPVIGVLLLDKLAAVFAGLISLVALTASIYAVGYQVLEQHNHSAACWTNLAYAIFILAMILVVTASNMVGFLFAWELMALASYLLVVSDVRKKESAKAGVLYLVMTHGAAAFLIVAFLLWSNWAGTPDFSGWAASAAQMPAGIRSALFLMLLVGFAAKAGAVPLHIWLPEAHPAAPSHVSALMSGAMLKTAIYGLLRFCVTLLPESAAWWGIVVLLIGVVSAVICVLYAVVERDIKRLLAYSSAENNGIILMSIGAGMTAQHYGLAQVASLAFAAALFHALNHATFKSLLFMNAGAIIKAAGSRSLDYLGGLIRRMPWTAASFLVGAMAIASLPPLNGFASEWAVFQSLIGLSRQLSGHWSGLLMPLAASGLALTGAMAAYAFVKAFGMAFLGVPRTQAAAEAKEVTPWMWVPPALLVIICIALGLFPQGVLTFLADAVPVAPAAVSVGATAAVSGISIEPHWFVLFGAVSALIVWSFRRLRRGNGSVCGGRGSAGNSDFRIGETWSCGYPVDHSMEYTATAYAQPVMRVFRKLLKPRHRVQVIRHRQTPFAAKVNFAESLPPIFMDLFYRPLQKAALFAAAKIRHLQNGKLQNYLLYILITLVVLLIITRLHP
jgi:hydrogenase-4 component B